MGKHRKARLATVTSVWRVFVTGQVPSHPNLFFSCFALGSGRLHFAGTTTQIESPNSTNGASTRGEKKNQTSQFCEETGNTEAQQGFLSVRRTISPTLEQRKKRLCPDLTKSEKWDEGTGRPPHFSPTSSLSPRHSKSDHLSDRRLLDFLLHRTHVRGGALSFPCSLFFFLRISVKKP